MKATHLIFLLAASAALPSAATAGIDIGINIGVPDIVVRTQPPPERVETIPMSPGPGYVWVRGHWAWHHEHWEWLSGRWERPATPGSVWIPGHWDARGGGWVWVEGRFEVQAPEAPAGPEIVVNEAPPAPLYETAPPPPGPEFFWIGGHWEWRNHWVWIHGRYERHPHFHPGGGWEPARWERRGGSWVWHEGHWR